MGPSERYRQLRDYLAAENPVLLEVMKEYEALDAIAHDLGFLPEEKSYTDEISWWPLISILGTFSAGKSSFINHYLGKKVQQSGNQAIDDKFTVLCYGENEEPMTLPGLALDADPRFPFYNISEEVEKVEKGEGSRVNIYLQLKTLKAENLKGKILIDSPGFDADAQRDAILRITSHIVGMSDLVLIFFDARHPEPGAMRDTLEHLVGHTMNYRDSDKILYILNQIDTTAREDNLEEVMGAWQRALSQRGLLGGDFYAIYNEELRNPIEDTAVAERLKRKRDEDYRRIVERMEGVKIERAYRISKALEDYAKALHRDRIPSLDKALRRWGRNVLLTDLLLLLILGGFFGQLLLMGLVPISLESLTIGTGLLLLILVVMHFKVKSLFARRVIRQSKEESLELVEALRRHMRWYRSVWSAWRGSWVEKVEGHLARIVDKSRAAIRRLNDQYVRPGGSSGVSE
ncbi:dynamin family protein [Nitratifractor sp.]